ncbi:MAG: hypothetical protein FJX32_10880 [Alphaproteobacteria bacterium]|nr:hypothetical protein [Alphaproteobacteria bacterium]
MLQDAPAIPTTLMVQFLRWLEERPRSYADTMDAWRSNCPRLSAWEDALEEGLIQLEPARDGAADMQVRVTAKGRARLVG